MFSRKNLMIGVRAAGYAALGHLVAIPALLLAIWAAKLFGAL